MERRKWGEEGGLGRQMEQRSEVERKKGEVERKGSMCSMYRRRLEGRKAGM